MTLPLSAPGIVAGCILVGIPATGEYVIPTILGGGKTLMYGNLVATQFQEAGDIPLGSALAAALDGRAPDRPALRAARRANVERGSHETASGRHICRWVLTLFVMGLGLYAPLVLVVINAFNKNVLLTMGRLHLGVGQAGDRRARVRQDFLTSAEVAIASSVLALVIAVPAGLWARQRSPRGASSSTRPLTCGLCCRRSLPRSGC